MREDLLEILRLMDKLSRAVELGDIDLSSFREDIEKLYLKIKSS